MSEIHNNLRLAITLLDKCLFVINMKTYLHISYVHKILSVQNFLVLESNTNGGMSSVALVMYH